MSRFRTLFLVLLLAGAPLAALAEPGDVRVRIVGIEQASGTVNVALFASEVAYETDDRIGAQMVAARVTGVEVVFAKLPPGSYALSIFHDVNGNQELDTNLVGMPTEPYGFSQNARGSFGPPSFSDMAFEIGTEGSAMEVRLE